MEETAARGWSEIENITVMLDEYNWPQFPAIAIDDDGVVHAFWYQEFANGMMEPTGEAIYYKTRAGGAWSDQSELLADHVGNYTALALESSGDPTFVWAEDIEDNRDVFLARYRDPVDVPPDAVRASLSFMVRPNPCCTEATVGFALDRPGWVRVDVYNVTGRLVARLADGIREAGQHKLVWDGRNRHGIKLPSAVYHVRLVVEEQWATESIVLLE